MHNPSKECEEDEKGNINNVMRIEDKYSRLNVYMIRLTSIDNGLAIYCFLLTIIVFGWV